MQTSRTEAIILRRTNYGEADRIVHFITPERGKLTAIAKGVRKSKSKLAGGLELFATCDVTIADGRGQMSLITSARLIKFYGGILHDYERMQLGYAFIKIINRITETVSESDFYYLLRDSFAYLNEPSIDYRLIELWFTLHCTAQLGHGLNLATTVDNERLSSEKRYNFDFHEMALVQHVNGRFISGHIKLLRLAQTKNPAVLRQVSGLEGVLEDCLWLARTLNT